MSRWPGSGFTVALERRTGPWARYKVICKCCGFRVGFEVSDLLEAMRPHAYRPIAVALHHEHHNGQP